MKITVDTEIDKPDDIRKVVALLNELANKVDSTILDPNKEEMGTENVAVFANMFATEEKTEQQQKPQETEQQAPKILPY